MENVINRKKIKLVNLVHNCENQHVSNLINNNITEISKISNLGELVFNLNKLCDQIKMYNFYSKVSISMSLHEPKEDEIISHNIVPVDVMINLKVKRKFYGSIKTEISQDGGAVANAALKVCNVLNSLINLEFDVSRGYSDRSYNEIAVSRPIPSNPFHRLLATIFSKKRQFASRDLSETGYGINFAYMIANSRGIHKISIENTFRQNSICAQVSQIPFIKRSQAGPSCIASLQHSWISDGRDSKIFPNFGSMVRLDTQLDYVNVNKLYLKTSFNFQKNHTFSSRILNDSVLSLSLRSGHILPLNGESKNTSTFFNDRFFLGGPSSIRGTNYECLGPSINGNIMGADSFIATGVHLHTFLPFINNLPASFRNIRTHSFFEGYKMSENDRGYKFSENLKIFHYSPFKFSMGFGLALNVKDSFRLELNLSTPLNTQMIRLGKLEPKFGFGLMAEFD